MLAVLAMGLLISSVARNQFVAGQIAIIATFLPAFILSGFVFDIDSMPHAIQLVTHVVAARYFVAILQIGVPGRRHLVGDRCPMRRRSWRMAAIFLGLARAGARKRLD